VGKSNANALGFALSEPLFAFVLGVLLSAIAFGARYLTTYAQGSARWSLAIWFNRAAIGLAVLAYAVFFAGVWWAYLAFRIHFAAAP
jgi:hypothetical protein